MNHNHYADTLAKVELTTQKKNNIVNNALLGATERNKKKSPVFLKICLSSTALLIMVIAVFNITGVFNMIIPWPSENNPPNSIGKVLARHLGYNNNVYWEHGGTDIVTVLPEGYFLVGKILSACGIDDIKPGNFVSSFGRIGAEIYANPANKYSVYLSLREGEDSGYQLFTTQTLRDDILMYNGKLYGNTSGVSAWSYDKPWNGDDFKLVGKIYSIIYDALPAKDFQCNIFNAEGAEIYVGEQGDVIYVKTWVSLERNEQYLYIKLLLNDLFY